MANALTKVTGNVIDSTTNITAGIITATSFVGSGANLTGVASTDNIRTNTNATFLQNINVTGIVTAAGVNASGVITATSSIVGSAVTINASGINATGVITTTSSIVGSAVTINASGINATGVITATSFSGSGANLTGLAATANVTTSSLVVIGVSTVAAGSTAAPSITPTGDSNTGIFFPSADTIAFAEGGSEALRIDSSGNLKLSTAATSILNSSGGKILNQTGSILQAVQGITTTVTSTTSTSYVNTALSASITPTASTNKIWALVTSSFTHSLSNYGAFFSIFRNGASGTNLAGANGWGNFYTGGGDVLNIGVSLAYLDSPATTSALTYNLCIKSESASNTISCPIVTGNTATILLMEIAA